MIACRGSGIAQTPGAKRNPKPGAGVIGASPWWGSRSIRSEARGHGRRALPCVRFEYGLSSVGPRCAHRIPMTSAGATDATSAETAKPRASDMCTAHRGARAKPVRPRRGPEASRNVVGVLPFGHVSGREHSDLEGN